MGRLKILLLVFFYTFNVLSCTVAKKTDDGESAMHDFIYEKGSTPVDKYELTSNFWNEQAQEALKKKLSSKLQMGVAKNVILFLGDGMSLPTVTAARIYLGQESGKSGQAAELSFDKFPYSGLSKTYCIDSQVADSACSSTAYLCGVKGNKGTIGVNGAVSIKNCKAMKNQDNQVDSIAAWSQKKGKSTGIVTTTRVTHASPAGTYAHTADRNWESDDDVTSAGEDPKLCPDIATQLINGATGKNFDVILGGGRRSFLPNTTKDEDGNYGKRKDKRNLIDEWSKLHKKGKYVTTRKQLSKVSSKTTHLLGLFATNHLEYRLLKKKKSTQPSLKEMTEAAIKILSKNKKGYFLFVEGGRIDHGHHGALAHKAINETVEFHKAIEAAIKKTKRKDTLIVVTSDHSHTMSLSGYPGRSQDILGIGGMGSDDLPYSVISYANGPGYKPEEDNSRYDMSNDDLRHKDYKFPAPVPKKSESHGGDDVGIFASGPWEHLFSGVMEQSVIPHLLAYASCVGNGKTACNETAELI